MDTNEADRILVDACLVAKNAWLNGLATEIGQLRGHYQELAEREESLSKELEALWSGYRKLAEREKALTEALEKAAHHLSSIGYPVDENGQYKAGGTNWSFTEAVPKKADSVEVLAAYEAIEAAIALHKE